MVDNHGFIVVLSLEWLNLFEETSLIARFLGANKGPIWGRQDPGGLHIGPMNFAFRDNMYGLSFLDAETLQVV